MSRFGKSAVLAFIFLTVPAVALAASGASRVAGTWKKLPTAPITVDDSLASVWTGKQLLVYGRHDGSEVAAAYDSAANSWTKLATPDEQAPAWGYRAVWTGKEMLVWSPFGSEALNPATKTWRHLKSSLPGGIIVWTGRDAIGWGGGCCGDAYSNGAAYNPRTNTFRKLPRGPLAPSQGPIGAWDGRELLLFVSGFDPDGKPYPARLARAAAYDPATNRWRRIAPAPARGGTAVWNGRQLLLVAAGARARQAFAYTPATNRWRRLASLPATRLGPTAVWTGHHVLLWGGENTHGTSPVRDGVAYDPGTNRWTAIPRSPLRPRDGTAVVWTGRSLIVWGGVIGTPAGTSIPPKHLADGAMFTPSARATADGDGMCGG
jgi:hypothetical protein